MTEDDIDVMLKASAAGDIISLTRVISQCIDILVKAAPEPLQVGIIIVHPDMPQVTMMGGTATIPQMQGALVYMSDDENIARSAEGHTLQ